ncbi:hypothetical protein [Bradyrhizobium sp. McL0616]|uniref:hypothetical protein n=1 Tax=Bradyrhizobium sp. McL0616 TaxID=3415674 RepID=UPI003CFAB91B
MTDKSKSKRSTKTLTASLPALIDYQRDMHAAHRQMTRSVRLFVRQMEGQMAELRRGLDQHLAAQRDEAHRYAAASHTRGVGGNISKNASDRCSRPAQDSL